MRDNIDTKNMMDGIENLVNVNWDYRANLKGSYNSVRGFNYLGVVFHLG